jgi:hypothetical protein
MRRLWKKTGFHMKITIFKSMMMGVETPIPPVAINVAAPKRDAPAAI